jgi:DNA-binding transcriptional MerR regulator
MMFKIREFARLSQVSLRTLRYYDAIGLLKPARVDPFTGYRFYTAAQLVRLARILVLKDLGLALDEIARVLDQPTDDAALHELLQLKHAALRQQRDELHARLRRVEARLALTEERRMTAYDVLLKPAQPIRAAALRASLASDHDTTALFTTLGAQLETARIPLTLPPIAVWYDNDKGPADETQDVLLALPVDGGVPRSAQLEIVELPTAELLATTVHRGSLSTLGQAYVALHRWADENGYRVVGPSRVVYVQGGSDAFDPAAVLEVQLPVQPEQRLAPLDGVLGPDQLAQVTERARQVLAVAAASTAGTRPVTTADLLRAIAHVSHSLGSAILTRLGITAEMPGTTTSTEAAQTGRPMTAEAARVWQAAAAVAEEWQHDYLGTEHLLLGLVADQTNDAVVLLAQCGVSPASVQEQIATMLQRSRPS